MIKRFLGARGLRTVTSIILVAVLLGGVYVLTILFLPTGLIGIPARLRQRRSALGERRQVKLAPSAS